MLIFMFQVLVKVKPGFNMGEACVSKQTTIMTFMHKHRQNIAMILSMFAVFAGSFYGEYKFKLFL